MPWRREAMKDVASCDKPREAASRHLIRGCPNGETHYGKTVVPPTESIGREERTQGSEPSQYLEEKKAIAIPKVVASEIGTAQTHITLLTVETATSRFLVSSFSKNEKRKTRNLKRENPGSETAATVN